MSSLIHIATFFLSVLTVRSSYVLQADPITHKAITEVNDGSQYAPVFIEMFMDLLDPNIRADWDTLRTVVNGTSDKDVRFVVYQFPLPWNGNSYLSTEAYFYVKESHPNQVVRYINDMLDKAMNLTTQATMGMTEVQVIGLLSKMTAETIPKLDKKAFEKSLTTNKYSSLIKQSVRYGFTRGVKRVPYFFVNGAEVTPGRDRLNKEDWKSLIGKLKISNKTPKEEEIKYETKCKIKNPQTKRKHAKKILWPWQQASAGFVTPAKMTIGISIFIQIAVTFISRRM